MSLKRLFLLLSFSVLLQSVLAQKVVVSGTVTDAYSGEQITGAYIVLTDTVDNSNPPGCVSNKAGFYSVSVYPGSYHLKAYFMGYKEKDEVLTLTKNQTVNLQLIPDAILTDEVVVTGHNDDQNVSSVDVGKVDIQVQTIKKMPAFLGEADVMKVVQLLP